ncbi:MAG: hypothetical protein J1E03_07970 [Acetatifactor sp.]|nr:hypothetical protein [Acetatifactor sp.]
MKKMNKAFLMLGIVAILTGCGQAVPAGNLPQNITAGTNGSQSDAENNIDKGNEEKQDTEASDQSNDKKENGIFSFIYEGVKLTPGEVFEQSMLGEASGISERETCAFGEKARVYNYEMFELETYVEGEKELIYSIYFIDPNLPTTEGLCLGDTVDDMKALYGENYEMEGSSYDYSGGDTMLAIITQNDVVMSIEYRLKK